MLVEDLLKILGGVSLFLLGMAQLSSGLKDWAGNSIKYFIQKSAKSKWQGLLWGFGLTALVQSSSAISIAMIGFVNAGMLHLENAVYLIYGSNIGTSATAWLVSQFGLNINIEKYALAMMIVGSFAQFFLKKKKQRALAQAVMGFGLVFFAIAWLRSHLLIYVDQISWLNQYPVWMYILLAIFSTMLLQSSSSVIAMVITLASTGVIPFITAIYMIVGANIGTTSTAWMASLNASPNAKRLAWMHICFNLIWGTCLILLIKLFHTPLLQGLTYLPQHLALAIFDTVQNTLGILIFLPFTAFFIRFLKKRFVQAVEQEATLKFIKMEFLQQPELALKMVTQELQRIQQMFVKFSHHFWQLHPMAEEDYFTQRQIFENLLNETSRFIQEIHFEEANHNNIHLTQALRVCAYFTEILEIMDELTGDFPQVQYLSVHNQEKIKIYFEGIHQYFKTMLLANVTTKDLDNNLKILVEEYRNIKQSILDEARAAHVELEKLADYLEFIQQARRVTQRMYKAELFLKTLVI